MRQTTVKKQKKPKDTKPASRPAAEQPFTGIRIPKMSELARLVVIGHQFLSDEVGLVNLDATHSEEFMKNLLGNVDEAFVRAVIVDDQPVGCVGAFLNPNCFRPEPVVTVLWIGLSPSHRKGGWGTKLLSQVETWGRSKGAFEVWSSAPLNSFAAAYSLTAFGYSTAEALYKKVL